MTFDVWEVYDQGSQFIVFIMEMDTPVYGCSMSTLWTLSAGDSFESKRMCPHMTDGVDRKGWVPSPTLGTIIKILW